MSLDPEQKPHWELLDLEQSEYEYILFDSTICEFTDISGFSILYYVKLNTDDFDKVDKLYGEDPTEEFSEGYRTKITYEPSEEPQVLNVFGMSSDDTLQYVETPKTIFSRDVEDSYLSDYTEETELQPKVGDCIRTLWNNKIYEIVEYGSEQRIFQGKKLIWEFILRPYRHAEESDSAEDMLFYEPDEEDFPDSNEDTTTKELSAYGENDYIEDESKDIYSDLNGSLYGY